MSESSPLSTEHRQIRMLNALIAHHGIVSRAAKSAGITPQTHYNWYRQDNEYAKQVNQVKHECHEQFKDLVIEAVIKKVRQGNTTIIAMCYKSLFKDMPDKMERHSPFRERLDVAIKLVGKPQPVNYSKDPFTQEAIKEYEDRLLAQRKQPPPNPDRKDE